MNAPTAAPNPPCGTAAVASSAAPGVDHAIVIGTLSRHEKNTVPRPIVRQRARRPEAAWFGEAPTAASPVSTTANERSEEHTSELQSLMRISYAVFCLKKKKNPKPSN